MDFNNATQESLLYWLKYKHAKQLFLMKIATKLQFWLEKNELLQ